MLSIGRAGKCWQDDLVADLWVSGTNAGREGEQQQLARRVTSQQQTAGNHAILANGALASTVNGQFEFVSTTHGILQFQV